MDIAKNLILLLHMLCFPHRIRDCQARDKYREGFNDLVDIYARVYLYIYVVLLQRFISIETRMLTVELYSNET